MSYVQNRVTMLVQVAHIEDFSYSRQKSVGTRRENAALPTVRSREFRIFRPDGNQSFVSMARWDYGSFVGNFHKRINSVNAVTEFKGIGGELNSVLRKKVDF